MKLSTKTSGVSLHFEKHNGGVNGLQRHNERKPGQRHANKRIKDDRTKDNVVLKRMYGTYEERINRIIKKNRDGGLKSMRKDAVRMVEATVQLSGQVLDRDKAEQERVLRESYDWLKDTFGEQNILSAVIHKDETNMHLHFDFVPITNGKLSAKKVISRSKLKQYQKDFLEFLQKAEPTMNFERGGGEYNGLTQQAYEYLQTERHELMKEVEEREIELDERENNLEKNEIRLQQKETLLNQQADSVKVAMTKYQEATKTLDSKVKELNDRQKDAVLVLNKAAGIKQREDNVTRREIAVLNRESDMDVQERSFKLREQSLLKREKAQKVREDKLDDKEQNLLKTQNTVSESIDILNALMNKGLRLTESRKREIHKTLEKYSPVTEENLPDLTLDLQQLQQLQDLQRKDAGLTL